MRAAAGWVVAGALAAGAVARAEEPPFPRTGDLNRVVLRLIERFPADGTHRYNWPKDGTYGGVTEDLIYEGEVVAAGNAAGDTYCCGLTFEVFFKAWQAWATRKKVPFRVGALDAAGLRRLRADWYCASGNRDGPVKALVDRGLGVRITRLEDARPGDFVQLWRTSGSGHSVIFVSWEKDRKGALVAMRYWSTQKSTNGIGYRVERFTGDAALKADELYIARAGAPPR